MKKIVLLVFLGISFFCYFYFAEYFTLTSLKNYHDVLFVWTHSNPIIAVIVFMSVYTLAAICCMPAIAILTLLGGFLFGPMAFLYVVIGKTLGSVMLFLLVRNAFGDWLLKHTSEKIAVMEKNFRENAFRYLLFLRLIPVFPFWLINVGAALLEVRLRTFIVTTFFGIMPGTAIYVWMGRALLVVPAKAGIHLWSNLLIAINSGI